VGALRSVYRHLFFSESISAVPELATLANDERRIRWTWPCALLTTQQRCDASHSLITRPLIGATERPPSGGLFVWGHHGDSEM